MPHLVNCFEHLSHLCSVTWLLSVCFRRVWSFKFDFLLKVASHREHVRRFLGVKVDLDFAWQIALKFQNFIQEVDKFLGKFGGHFFNIEKSEVSFRTYVWRLRVLREAKLLLHWAHLIEVVLCTRSKWALKSLSVRKVRSHVSHHFSCDCGGGGWGGGNSGGSGLSVGSIWVRSSNKSIFERGL